MNTANKYVKCIFSLLFLFWRMTGSCQDYLSFDDCLKLAYENNLSLKNAEINEKLSLYQHASVKTKILPSLNASAANNFSRSSTMDPSTNLFSNIEHKSYSGNISLRWSLFSGFLNLNTLKQARQEVEINKQNIQKVKDEIMIEVAFTFITILYLEETIKANREQLQSTQKQLELAQSKFEAGYIAESEVFRIRSQQASEELTLTNNQNRLSLTYVELKQLLNLPLDKEVALMKLSESFLLTHNFLSDEMEMIKRAVEINPSFAMVKMKEEKARTNISLTRAPFFPSISFGTSYSSDYSSRNQLFGFKDQLKNNLSGNLSLNISIPLFNQFQNTFKLKLSKLSYQQSKIETALEKNRLSKVVFQAINDTKASQKKYTSSSSAYEFAKKSHEAELLKFELGKIPVTELLITKTTLANTQAELIRAKYEFIINISLIEYYLGRQFKL